MAWQVGWVVVTHHSVLLNLLETNHVLQVWPFLAFSLTWHVVLKSGRQNATTRCAAPWILKQHLLDVMRSCSFLPCVSFFSLRHSRGSKISGRVRTFLQKGHLVSALLLSAGCLSLVGMCFGYPPQVPGRAAWRIPAWKGSFYFEMKRPAHRLVFLRCSGF